MKEVYFPDDLWRYMLTFVGFEKYYLIPVRRRPLIHDELILHLSNRCFRKLLHIMQVSTHLSTCLIRAFIFMTKHNVWIQQARQITRIWDRFSYMLAIRCQTHLVTLVCGCGEEECVSCYAHTHLDRVSRMFYTIYVE